MSAYLAGVERSVISEVPFDIEKLASLLMRDKHSIPSNYAMMTISEGATMVGGELVQGGKEDAYGHRKLGGIGEDRRAPPRDHRRGHHQPAGRLSDALGARRTRST